jgi:hypothetical protein
MIEPYARIDVRNDSARAAGGNRPCGNRVGRGQILLTMVVVVPGVCMNHCPLRMLVLVVATSAGALKSGSSGGSECA